MNLIDVSKQFATEEQCLDYIEKMRWPDGKVRCPNCGNDGISRIQRKSESKNKRNRLYQCLESTCMTQFSATAGTIFHDSHLPLTKWFTGIALVLNAKKGMSALQLQRDLGVGSYRTAWYLYHRIREAMVDVDAPKLSGIVEVDETYIGGKRRGFGHSYAKKNKLTVFGARQRGGELRFIHTPNSSIGAAHKVIASHVSSDVELLMTDESPIYPIALSALKLKDRHRTIRHRDRRYVDGVVSTNSIESAFSLFKRGIVGNFHKVSIKHLCSGI
jgi:predicted RNA-binding Zn-ribbon protein involved in translation (DUF1610 family)